MNFKLIRWFICTCQFNLLQRKDRGIRLTRKHTVNLRISARGAYFKFRKISGVLFRGGGGAYSRGGERLF